MFLLQNVVTNAVIFSGILALLLMILLLVLSIKAGNKKKIIGLIVLILIISPFSINSIEDKMRIAKRAKKIERSIENSLREEDYILLEKQLDKKILARLVEEKEKKDNERYGDIESELNEETREVALERITDAIKLYKQHHAEEQEKKENIFINEPTIYINSEF